MLGHDVVELCPLLLRDVKLLQSLALAVQEEDDWRLPRHLLELCVVVVLLKVFQDELLHLRETVQLSSGAGLDPDLDSVLLTGDQRRCRGQQHKQ